MITKLSQFKFLFEILGFVFEDNKQTIDTKLLEAILNEQNIEFENDIDVSINKFVIKRNDHRKNKEFEIADYMRDRLDEVGIVIEDGNENRHHRNKFTIILHIVKLKRNGIGLLMRKKVKKMPLKSGKL